MASWVTGIDLGASKVALGLVSPGGDLVATRRFPTEAQRGPGYALDHIALALAEMATEANIALSDVDAVGVCSPRASRPCGWPHFGSAKFGLAQCAISADAV